MRMAFAPANTLFDEITDFLASGPSPTQLVAFKPSAALDQRLHTLLDQKSRDGLGPKEQAELDEFLRMNHFLNMVVLKARLHLAGKS
jgi:hypothetical protein